MGRHDRHDPADAYLLLALRSPCGSRHEQVSARGQGDRRNIQMQGLRQTGRNDGFPSKRKPIVSRRQTGQRALRQRRAINAQSRPGRTMGGFGNIIR